MALLLALPIMLTESAAGQSADPGADAPPELVDPDCFERPDDPELLLADPALVAEPDGVCPPGEERPRDETPPMRGPVAQPDPPSAAPPSTSLEAALQGAPPLPQRLEPEQGRWKEPGGREQLRARRGRAQRGPSGGVAAPAPPAIERNSGGREGRRAHDGKTDVAPGGTEPTQQAGALPGTLAAPGAGALAARGPAVPRFLRAIYRAAEERYGVRWEILAAVNEIETDYGRNLNVSSAGATGWMQFMPATWRVYGTDASGDGVADPYDPEDAIFSAARYLKASGYPRDVRGALYAYNHALWYVESVLLKARRIAAENRSLPRARLLAPAFAARLARVADSTGVPWELMLAVLRARGEDGSVPAGPAELHALARRLVRLGAHESPRGAVHRLAAATRPRGPLPPSLLAREATFAERVLALAHYNKAVGRAGLVHGLGAVQNQLAGRTLRNRRLAIYPGGRADIARGVTDPRVLVLLNYLASRYDSVTVTSLTTGHSVLTASGNVSAHTHGRAVDIAALGDTPILGNQERGGLTERALWRILLLPDEVEPRQLISLFALGGPSFALTDHADHIHAGF